MQNDITTLEDIAGYCTEEAVWKMLVDLCQFIEEDINQEFSFLYPNIITVEGDTFLVAPEGIMQPEFLAPENKRRTVTPQGTVWTLGALAYYASTGQIVFGGRGGFYQASFPQAPLPVVQKAHRRLNPVLQRCLVYDPSKRMGIEELFSIARKEHARCMEESRLKAEGETPQNERTNTRPPVSDWPEPMIES